MGLIRIELNGTEILMDLLNRVVDKLLLNSSYRRVMELGRRERERPRGDTSWFTVEEVALVEVLASLIVPSDETSPGAKEADVVDTIDRMVATSPHRKKLYWFGLCSFDEWARRWYGRKFQELSVAEQNELLTQADNKYKKWETCTSLADKIRRKLDVLHCKKNGIFFAVQLFPRLVRDVHQAFYTSSVSWIWLGYDGPPMPHGYPDLAPRRQSTETFQIADSTTKPSLVTKRLKILVCLKQVPSSESRYRLNESATGIQEDNLLFETNEGDLYALEEALRLREKFGGEVLILSLGEKRVLKTLRGGLAMGADRAIHLIDSGFQDTDPFVAAKAMAAAVRREEVDLVLTGVESSDYAEGQMAGILAQLLGWSHAAIVAEVGVDEDCVKAVAKRELGSNLHERLEIPLPAVLAVQSGTYQPRYPTLKGIMQAKTKEIGTFSAEELGLETEEVGSQGSILEYISMCTPDKAKGTVMFEGTPEEVTQTLMLRLRDYERLF